MKENLATVLETVARIRPDSIAVSHAGRDVIWRELEEEAARLARHLHDAGIAHGSRVAVVQYNGPEYLATLWAVLKLRAVPVNVNFRYKTEEITALLDDAHVEAAVYDAALDATVEPAVAAAAMPLRTAVVLHTDTPGEGRVAYDEVQRTCRPLPAIERGDDDWLMYTGGTTGQPRGVLGRHSWLYNVICANSFLLMGLPIPGSLAELEDYLRSVPGDAYPIATIPAPPLMHATGSYTSLGALVAGGRVAYLAGRSYDADELLRLVEQQRADTLSIVGDVFARPMADALDKARDAGRPYDLSSLRRVISVGVTWSAECKQRLLAHGDFLCRDIVAASEGGPFAVCETRRGDEVVTSRFSLLPGARIVDEAGRDVVPGSGQVGMLAAPTDEYIHYQGDEAKTAQTFRVFDGRRWAVPGDLASVDETGTVTFHGRGSQVINTGGEKVFAEEVENVVLRHPTVRDAMVVGVSDPRWGQRVAAVVALHDGGSLTLEDLKEHVGRELANYKRPTVLVAVDELKRSPSGKADTRWARATTAEALIERNPSVTEPTVATGVEGVKALVGRPLGHSDWHEVTQEQVNLFADSTGDHQWIHVDAARAKDGPYGTTIAHGFLTLSMIPKMLPQILRYEGFSLGVNYGLDRVRFPAPVPVGSKVRATAVIDTVKEIEGGVQTTLTVTFEIEGGSKPVCVAQSVVRQYV